MKKYVIALIFTAGITSLAKSQDYPLLPDHPGTFKLIDWGVYTHNDCGFTKAETAANYQKIIKITDLVRKNLRVFVNQKGFECETYVFAEKLPRQKPGMEFPAPSVLDSAIGLWIKEKPKYYRIEPPSWSVSVNQFNGFLGAHYFWFRGSETYRKTKTRVRL